ncbi:MAG: aspartate--ammonia ligase [Clostridia bacterium]|nr:aspartate--ammonia ligase [Clostridia bacterium]
MSKTQIPASYKSCLSIFDTQMAIGKVHHLFEEKLSEALNVKRVSAPLFVDPDMGLNDNLNGFEQPVSFTVRETGGKAEVVHSLAKWKRMALGKYEFHPGKGLYTDMNAIRREEELDNIHSIYVDQWDWEKVITRKDRTVAYLKETVCAIVNAVCDTLDALKEKYPQLQVQLDREVTFITAQELYDRYPDLTAKEREDAFAKEKKTIFIMQIGGKLKNGERHDGRAPDYDDWALNGDLLFWNERLGHALEISSMGIRVDAESLDRQLSLANCDDRRSLPFHQMILKDELPLTIGGGIGQSRLCMLLLDKAHIGEVQVSLWDEETIRLCNEAGVKLL